MSKELEKLSRIQVNRKYRQAILSRDNHIINSLVLEQIVQMEEESKCYESFLRHRTQSLFKLLLQFERECIADNICIINATFCTLRHATKVKVERKHFFRMIELWHEMQKEALNWQMECTRIMRVNADYYAQNQIAEQYLRLKPDDIKMFQDLIEIDSRF